MAGTRLCAAPDGPAVEFTRFILDLTKSFVNTDDMLRPTRTELEILRVLWQSGPATVRDLQREWSTAKGKPVGYTTALKFLQIMTEKGLVDKDDSSKPQTYRARYTEDNTRGQLVKDLLQRVFDGSTKDLVLHLLEDKRATDAELEEVEKLLDRLERRRIR
jgi:BlaI family penicillinase repressor